MQVTLAVRTIQIDTVRVGGDCGVLRPARSSSHVTRIAGLCPVCPSLHFVGINDTEWQAIAVV